jgi:hypothetical protein
MGGLEFLKSLLRSFVDGLRRNKLPAVLSAVALILTTALALTSDYDERPRYRKLILPTIAKAEQQFFSIMHEAENEPDGLWRLQYFLEGHRRAKAVLRVLRDEHPMTAAGRRAQRELARYYELVDEQLAIIRTEFSFNESFDYIGEWKRRNAELLPFRERWLTWLQTPQTN